MTMTTTTMLFTTTLLLATTTTIINGQSDGESNGPKHEKDDYNYVRNDFSRDGDYGLEDWNRVGCNTDNINKCGPDSWHMANDWQINKDDKLYPDAEDRMDNNDDYYYEGNRCMWCPIDKRDSCSDPLNGGGHHMGPIMLERERGYYGDKDGSDDGDKDGVDKSFICKDTHWMKYWDGSCDWNDLTNNPETEFSNNFFIRRHGLHIYQPHDTDGNLKCPSGNINYISYPVNETTYPKENAYPKLDYSKGFPDWWYLSHMEIKTPSEFAQNGATYDGEIRYYHFYSEPYEGKTPYRKIGVVSMFFETADNVQPDPFMDKLICQFRKTEEETRKECGLSSVTTHYPGCWNYNTPEDTAKLRRNLRESESSSLRGGNNSTSNTNKPREPLETFPDINKFVLDPDNDANYEEPYDFDEWVDEQILKGTHNEPGPDYPYADKTDADGKVTQKHRHLLNYDNVPYYAYQFMQNVQTEYYFRTQASLTVPPCTTETHWRVMKDPLRLHPRQLPEIQRLIAHRISPKGSKYRECLPDTAGKCEKKNGFPIPPDEQVDTSNVNEVCDVVNVARPLQYKNTRHRDRFCECKDWWSKFRGDRKWCDIQDLDERFFGTPYNWQTEFYAPSKDNRTLDKTLDESLYKRRRE